MSILTKKAAIEKGSPPVLMLVLLICIGFLAFLQLLCTPVMLPLVGKDLHLDTAELVFIWGMATFGGLFLALPGGLLGDRLGPRWSVFIIAVVIGLTMSLRGFAKDTLSLSILMFIGGGVMGSITPLSIKAIFTWFPRSRVGLANGLFNSFGRLGMAIGAAISVTLVAVALHGWQNTFLVYGAILIIFALLWLIIVREPPNSKSSTGVPFKEAFIMSVKNRDFWLCMSASFGVTGMNVVFTGYLPVYLQNSGWQQVNSSLALTLYLVGGVVGGFILLTLSDIVRLRKVFFLIPALIWICAIGLMSVLRENIQIWTLVLIAGFTYGCLLAILALIVAEIKGIGVRYAGTANSISFAIGGGAGMIFAVVGGKLALTNAFLPFIFAPLLCLVCIIPFFFTRETGIRNSNISRQE